jgi:glyoxylase-like metal-dependent hydrolase (beta-lactamase superfamily II)
MQIAHVFNTHVHADHASGDQEMFCNAAPGIAPISPPVFFARPALQK